MSTEKQDRKQRNDAFRDSAERTDAFIRGFYGRDTVDFMALAYRDSANLLIAERFRTSTHGDTVLWPAGFLYRHAYELYLKEILSVASDLEGKRDSRTGHSLGSLWTRSRNLLANQYGKSALSDLGAAEEALMALHNIDPRGDAFRYPTSIKGDANLAKLPEAVDVDHFSKVMGDGLEILSACLSDLRDRLDWRNEMNAQTNREY